MANIKTWNEYFFKLIDLISQKSKDPSTQVGCVIVGYNNEILSTGYNGFPIGVKDSKERYENRNTKLELVVHAEVNAIAFAAKNGHKLFGSKLYCQYIPCKDCAKSIIQAGITEIIYPIEKIEEWERKKGWKESAEISKLMFSEAGVKLHAK